MRRTRGLTVKATSTCSFRSEIVAVEIDAGTPEHLPVIVPDGQRIGIVRGDAANPGAHGEGDLDLLVHRGLVAAGAQAAMIVLRLERFQRVMRAEHAAA